MSKLSFYRNFVLLLALLLPALCYGEGDPLDKQLQSLTIPNNEAPLPLSQESLYSVQDRYVPLVHSSEVIIGAGQNVNADSYINSQELTLGYRYHANDHWHITAEGSYVTNSLSGAGQTLYNSVHMIPDAAYTKARADLLVGYNLFYGKFRAGMDQVFYFDQYIAVGPGSVWMNTGSAIGPVADIGGVFWFGKSFNAQLGVRDSYHREVRVLSSGNVNDVILHLDLGWRFGGGNI